MHVLWAPSPPLWLSGRFSSLNSTSQHPCLLDANTSSFSQRTVSCSGDYSTYSQDMFMEPENDPFSQLVGIGKHRLLHLCWNNANSIRSRCLWGYCLLRDLYWWSLSHFLLPACVSRGQLSHKLLLFKTSYRRVLLLETSNEDILD